jgi:hypothetical protein
MSSDENGNEGNKIIRNLFWGFYIVKPWFKRKVKVQQKTYQSPTGMIDHNAFFKAFGSMLFCMKIAFAVTFLLISIPIGIIRLIFALTLMKKRTDTSNANGIENNQ